jgi:hypothetical protein
MQKCSSLYYYLLISFTLGALFCQCKNAISYKSPVGYDFNKPEKNILNQSLHEISGIAFSKGNDTSVFAIEDENGKLYSYTFANEQLRKSKFGKKGDYEDVTTFNDSMVAVLNSDGSILLFPIANTGYDNIDSVQSFESILPAGEYEGLAAADSNLYALCKDCPDDKPGKEVSVQVLQMNAGKQLSVVKTFPVDISMIQSGAENGKIKFHPSALGKNPVTHEWFILSSVNKMLLVLDEQWKLISFVVLDPSLFKQPEGLTFNSKGDLYISNEGGAGAANILAFRYQHP